MRNSQKRSLAAAVLRLLVCSAILLAVSASSIDTSAALASNGAVFSKVDPWVLRTAERGATEFLVFLTDQADLSQAAQLPTKALKGEYVANKLMETARRTQGPVLAALRNMGNNEGPSFSYRPFWVVNAIWVRASSQTIEKLARRSDVAHLFANPSVKAQLPEATLHSSAVLQPQTIEWNIQKIRAPQVWQAGFNGQGVVVAGQDTGYNWDHPALIRQYRGWNGITADHNYSWHDAIHFNNQQTSLGNPCGFDSPVPCDDNSHGTHTMGTMVGDDGLGNQIGVAPGARWIGCRNMAENRGTPATYMECFQWFIAPTDLNGGNLRPDLAPDVINNSWACPASEGCTDPNILKAVVENVRAAGILTVQSAGNSGPACTTINAPAAIYDASFTVGATDQNDIITNFSSRGPVIVDGSGRLKPDVSAPGSFLRSSIPSSEGYNNYGLLNGTSMAGPHVVGLAALLLSMRPDLKGDVDRIENLIRQSAVPRTSSQICGGTPGSQVPNNTYGWGRVDAWNLFKLAKLNPSKHANPKSFESPLDNPGQIITYTITVRNPDPNLIYHNVRITDTIPTDTTFITATQPFIKSGDTVVWELPTLAANQSAAVDLVVQIDSTAAGAIVNQEYSFSSDKSPPSAGIPLTIYQIIRYYFPMVIGP